MRTKVKILNFVVKYFTTEAINSYNIFTFWETKIGQIFDCLEVFDVAEVEQCRNC